MSDVEKTDKDKRKTLENRLTLFALLAIFVAPVLFAYWAYFGGWFEGGSKSKGELVSPMWHIDDISIGRYSFGDWQDSDYMGKWNWFLILDQDTCDDLCELNWKLLTQTRKGLGKNIEKTNHLLMLNQRAALDMEQWDGRDIAFGNFYKGDLIVNRTELKGMTREPMPTNFIYLVDPLGNVFMRYPLIQTEEQAPLQSKDLRADLSRVTRFLDVGKKNG